MKLKHVMSLHAIIVSIMGTLGCFIPVKFQSQKASPFDTFPGTLSAFFVVLLAYAVFVAATVFIGVSNDTNDNDDTGVGARSTMMKLSLFCGSLAAILLLLIIVPVLGWVSLALWLLSLLILALYQLLINQLCALLRKVVATIHGLDEQVESAV